MWRQHHFFFLLVVILMGSVSLFGTDIYLPALPEMCDCFNCTQVEIQSSFTLYLLGLAFCQLVYGTLADRFGRKRITLVALTLFMLASYFCARANTLTEFLFFRALQSIGAGAGSVINRAIIADRFNKTEAAKIFSTIFPFIGLSAAIGPFIGGHLCSDFGWRSIFYFMTGFGLFVWILVLVFLEDSQKQKKEKGMFLENPIKKQFSAYLHLLTNRQFLGYTFALCAGFAAFRSFAVESPFVFNHQGYNAEEMGSFYIALSVAYVFGNLIAKHLLKTKPLERLLYMGFFFGLIGSGFMIVSSLYFKQSPYGIILPMAIVVLGNGFLFPMGSAGAMTAVPAMYSGRASGFMGALQFVFAATCINWVGKVCHGQGISLSLYIMVIVLMGLFSYRLLSERKAASIMVE
jgi:DHA1 family bicyclomycin/chloramphenicol resistance-like MFS transporter